jgi:hypothetical protein
MTPRRCTKALGVWPSFTLWLAVSAAVGGVACFVPLLQVLGYELSLAVSLLASLGAGHIASTLAPRLREGRWALGEREARYSRLCLRALAVGASLLAAPLALSLLNGFRIPPCNLAEGAAFFALDAIFSAVAAAAVGLFLGLLFSSARVAAIMWFAVWLGGIFAAGLTFYATPAVFLYGPFFGYFPGVLYDTLVEVRAPLVTYRAVTSVDIAALLAVAAAAFDPASLRLSRHRFVVNRRLAAVSVALVAAAIVLHALGPRLGHLSRRADLERELPVRVSRDGLDLFFPRSASKEEIAELADDAAFSLGRVEAFLEPESTRRVAVFFFASSEQKGRVMGASRTNVAKPWRSEVYVVMDDVPHEVLRHELAHAVAAEFGRGPFDVAGDAGGLVPNPGLIEGVASAAEGPRGELTHHQWAAAMKRLGILPSLGRAMGLEFFDFSASAVYTASGSFIAWLRDRRGAGVVRAIYGGASFEEATSESLRDLEKRWLAFLDTVPLQGADLGAARLRFDKPSVVRSICVHEVARLDAEADDLADEGDPSGTLAARKEACERSGDATDARYDLFKTVAAFRDESAIRDMARELERSPEMSVARRAQISEVLADLDAEAGRLSDASRAYAAIVPDAASDDVRRRLQVKKRLCETGIGAEPVILSALAAQRPLRGAKDALAALRIGELAAQGGDPWLEYLVGRQHFRYRDFSGALSWLEAAERDGLSGTTAEIESAGRMLHGRALFKLGRLEEARAVFEELAASPRLREGERELAADWALRCDFASRKGAHS